MRIGGITAWVAGVLEASKPGKRRQTLSIPVRKDIPEGLFFLTDEEEERGEKNSSK